MTSTDSMYAFLDESGTHSGSRVITIAGYVISPENLAILELEWRAVLAKYGMGELHMKEFVPPHGRYSHWSVGEKRSLIESLVELIHEFTSVGVGAAIEMTHFVAKTHAFAHSKSPDLVKSPYQWCLRYCMVQAAAWADDAKRAGVINYTADAGCVNAGRIQTHYALACESEDTRRKFRLGSLVFANSNTHPGLQCADLLAYEMYKEADRLLSGAARPQRASFLALFREHDRLVTIDSAGMKKEVTRGAQMHMAMLEHLPPKEKFQVMCYALRHMEEKNRKILFEMIPSMQNVYRACIAKGEMGKRLDEMPRELLPPDDPQWFLSRIDRQNEDVDSKEDE
jgi:hypothetical protein